MFCKRRNCHALADKSGFTILELVMVILLIAVLAAVAIPRFANVSGVRLGNAAVKIVSDIRYAQNRAATTQQRSRFRISSATVYDIYFCAAYDSGTCDCTSGWAYATDPGSGGNFRVDLNDDYSGVTISSLVGDCVEFDSLGRPYYNSGCGDAASCGSSAGAVVSITDGTDSESITVNTDTGMASY